MADTTGSAGTINGHGGVMGGINLDEIEFYTDLAMNESQRWIEAVTRERFFDEDDFLYSLRHGTQLRKILNIINPNSITLVPSCSLARPTCSKAYNLDEDHSELSESDDEESWPVEFLKVCRNNFSLNTRQLFRPNDLDALIDENGRQGCLPVETLSKIRRVVNTIYELALLCESSTTYCGPKLDKTALEPLVNYHKRINDSTCEGGLRFSAIYDKIAKKNARILHKDVKFILNSILDRVCNTVESSQLCNDDSDDNNFIENTNHNNKEHLEPILAKEVSPLLEQEVTKIVQVVEEKVIKSSELTTYQEKVSCYLRENDFTTSPSIMATTDYQQYEGYLDVRTPISPTRSDNVFYNSSTDLTYVRPFHQRDLSTSSEEIIPTRPQLRTTGASATQKEALKFVASKSHLDESARVQLEMMKEQHLSREQLQKEDDKQDWMNDFEGWTRKRQAKSVSALRRKSEREDVERLQTGSSLNRSTGGRSLNDVRFDYDTADKVEPTLNNKFDSTQYLSTSTYPPEENKDKSDVVTYAIRKAIEEERRSETIPLYGSEKTPRPNNLQYYLDTEEEKLPRHFQASTPLQSANNSVMQSLSPQREPVIETVRETTKVYEKRTTYMPQKDASVTSPYTVLTSSSKEENERNMQMLTFDRSPVVTRLIDVEGDSGVEMNPASPMPSPMYGGTDSLSPNSQSSGDGGHRVGKTSPVRSMESVSSNVRSPRFSDKPYEALTISIKQKPNSEKGFGFSVKGGKDRREPVVVNTVIADSSADKSRLQIGDEIVEIDGDPVGDKTSAYVNMALKEAVRIGQIELLLRRRLPQLPQGVVEKPVASPRTSRRQSSFDDTRERFERPDQTVEQSRSSKTATLPGKLQPSTVFSHRSDSRSSSSPRSPARFEMSGRTSNQKLNYSTELKMPPTVKTFTTSPSTRRKDPGRIIDFIPDVDRQYPASSEYKVTTYSQERPTPGKILDFVPDSERPKSHKPVYTQATEDDTADPHWTKERRIIEYSHDTKHQQHPSPDSEYHDAPRSSVHYDYPHMRPSVGESYSTSSKSDSIDSAPSSRPGSAANDLIVPVYNNKSVAALKVGKALNNRMTQQSPKVVYETTITDEHLNGNHVPSDIPRIRDPSWNSQEHVSDTRSHAMQTEQEFTRRSPADVSVLYFQHGNLIENSPDAANRDTYGLETTAFLEAKFRRMNSTRRLRNRLKTARLSFYGLKKNVNDENTSESDENFDVSPYVRRVEDAQLYQLAARLMSTSGTDLFFKGPTQFTYRIEPVQRKGLTVDRSVIVVPLRHRDLLEGCTKDSESGDRKNLSRPSDAPKPFGHVKHEPVAFSFEPIPGASGATTMMQKPTVSNAGVRPHNDASALYSEANLREIRNTFGQPSRQTNGEDSTELRYLELAAAEKAQQLNNSASNHMPRTSDIYDHWLVREAENLRLSDQLKAERLAKQRAEGFQPIERLPYNNYDQQYSGNDSDTLTQSQFEPEEPQYGYYGVDQSAVSEDLWNHHRPPSPKFPTNNALYNKYGLNLETDDDNKIVAVSDRQICAHCNKELGRGAAMTIESLGLYYHLQCFKCYVCQTPLGDGTHGADVRVKDRRLNCQRCFVNDQTGDVYTEL